MRLLLRLLVGGGAAAGAMFLAYRWLGAAGLVYTAPLMGVALASPLIEIGQALPWLAAHIALRKVAGRHVAYRGRSLDVHIDERAACWIATADLRKLVALPADAVLQRRFPAGCAPCGEPAVMRLDAQALLDFLASSTDPDLARFTHWLRRDVMRPARNKRALRLGLEREK